MGTTKNIFTVLRNVKTDVKEHTTTGDGPL